MDPGQPTLVEYAQFAAALTADGLVTDAWVDGRPRLSLEPFVLDAATHAAMVRCAEAVAGVLDELTHLVAHEGDAGLALTPVQSLLWQASAPRWHGYARADVFLQDDGSPICCEVNCDTPSGFPEAVSLGALAAARVSGGALLDPNEALPRLFPALLSRFLRTLAPDARPSARPCVGIVYPTELTEDVGLIELYRRWCTDAGFRVVLGSPYNLTPEPDGGVALFGQRCHLMVRHYKTDWWTERLPLWDDEAPFPDAAPLAGPLALLVRASLEGRCAVVNPFGAVVPQNKRAFALCWERIDRFSPEAQDAIRRYVPQTFRLETITDEARNELLSDPGGWVLKSDYGCEGEEVLVGAQVTPELWRNALARALPSRWIVQRRFCARLDDRGREANHGVFLIAGRAAGLYTRLSRGPTDGNAISVPTLVRS